MTLDSLRIVFKTKALAELRVIKELSVHVLRYWVPILACIFLFFALDIHAFNDIALRCSAVGGYKWATKAALYFGANVHANNDQALSGAALNGYNDIVKDLLHHGADVNARNGVALGLAIENGHTETVKLILSLGNLTADCTPASQLIRGFWLKKASDTGNREIIDMVSDRVKQLSASCPYTSPMPSKTPNTASPASGR